MDRERGALLCIRKVDQGGTASNVVAIPINMILIMLSTIYQLYIYIPINYIYITIYHSYDIIDYRYYDSIININPLTIDRSKHDITPMKPQ